MLVRNWNTSSFQVTEDLSQWLFSKTTKVAEFQLRPDTEFVAATLKSAQFRNRFQVVVQHIRPRPENGFQVTDISFEIRDQYLDLYPRFIGF